MSSETKNLNSISHFRHVISLQLCVWSSLDAHKQALELFSLICYNELRRKVGGSKPTLFQTDNGLLVAGTIYSNCSFVCNVVILTNFHSQSVL